MVKNVICESAEAKTIGLVNNKLSKSGYRHATLAKEMKNVCYALSSRRFFDDRFEIVSTPNSYCIHDLTTDKFFKIAKIGNIDYDMGVISIAPFIISKSPLKISEQKFNVLHKVNGYVHSVGTLEIYDRLRFYPSCKTKNPQITRCLPIE